jgi:hypothetical protein
MSLSRTDSELRPYGCAKEDFYLAKKRSLRVRETRKRLRNQTPVAVHLRSGT